MRAYRHGIFVEFASARSDKMEGKSGGARGIMTRTVYPGRWLSIVLALAAAGCKGLFSSQGLPHDPMFLDKQPISAKAQSAPPTALAFAEPTPPDNPALARRQPTVAAPPQPLPGTLTQRPRPEPPPDGRDDR
jgi:hypothetical protein